MTDAQFTLFLLGLAFISLLVGSTLVRRRRTPLDIRPIEGYQVLPLLIDEAVESNRLPHFSLGSVALGQASTVTALASAGVLYYLFKRFSFEQRLPLVTFSDPITLAVASDTLRKAYLARDNMATYRPGAVIWYPHGEKSVSFGAGAANHATDLDVSSHILLGTFGSEMIYFAEANRRRDQKLLAHSTLLEGQAVAYAAADHALLGEELFVGNAYLEPQSVLSMGGLIALDTLRWFVILVIIVATILNGFD